MKIIKTIIYLIPILIIGRLFWLNFVPSGVLEFEQTFDKKNAHFTDFRPGERLKPFLKDENAVFHRIIDNPIFFHISTPRQFQTVEFEITYRAKNAQNPLFGGQTGKELYEFDYKPFQVISDNNWHTQKIDFDLGLLYYHKKTKKYQFSFNDVKELDISKIKVVFKKSEITFRRLFGEVVQ